MKINGVKLKALREGAGFTYRELADDINAGYENAVISAATLNKWEINPDSKPSPSKVAKVAEYFDVALDELILADTDEYKAEILAEHGLESSIKLEIKTRLQLCNSIIEPLMLIDRMDNKYLIKQVNTAKEFLGTPFGISDEDLISAAMFGGLSWSQKGKTFSKEYVGILADLLALKNRKIEIDFEEQFEYVQCEDDIDKYAGKAGIYGILDANSGMLLRIGQTTDFANRFYEHMTSIEFGELESVLEYIPEGSIIDEDYYFVILAYAPTFKYAFQREFWLEYAECKMIISKGTYNVCNVNLTGDPFIPVDVQWDIYKAFSENEEEE